MIGGLTTSAGNTIAFNRRDGVRIEGASVDNAILTNSTFANTEIGINLVPPGPNGLPNPPTLTAVASSIGATIINGTLVGAPNSTYLIQFFFSSALDPTGVGEGGQFVGQATAVTGADGIATYSANVPFALKSGQFVTATATDASGNTSEFSSPLTEVFGTVQFQMAGYVVSEGVGTATIVATRVGGSGGDFTVNYATADGTGMAGSAYGPVSGTLTFMAGEDTQTFTVPVLDNGQPEGDVTVFLGLSNPVGPISLGAQSLGRPDDPGQPAGCVPVRDVQLRRRPGGRDRDDHRDPRPGRPGLDRELQHRRRHGGRRHRLHPGGGHAHFRARASSPSRSPSRS